MTGQDVLVIAGSLGFFAYSYFLYKWGYEMGLADGTATAYTRDVEARQSVERFQPERASPNKLH
jgi:hypothetical protein